MPIDYRTNDAVITVCQNNKAELVTISEINKTAEELIGFNSSELTNKPLGYILPERIVELLKEYIDFENDSNDVGTVLSKVQSFSVIRKNGSEKAYKIKISRTESSGNISFFSLVLQDTLVARKNEAASKIIKDNFKGHESLDMQTELPNRASLVRDIELIKHHSNTNGMMSCFAVVQIDGYDKFMAQNGNVVCNELVKFVASIASRSLRPDDIVGIVGDGRIGVLLVGITSGSERLILNRLRWQIASNPYIYNDQKPIGLSVSIGFYSILQGGNNEKIIERCESSLNKLGSDKHNTITDASLE
jgi:diguanylate cyclase (GGDEF)-like protein/PAS domain S-box-containing protein